MLVLCYGIPKSGSTLAFELVRGVLANAGYAQDPIKVENVAPTARGVNFMGALARGRASREDSGDQRHVSMTEESLTKIISEIGERIIAVKTHESFPPEMFAVLERLQADRRLQVIASYRDPRDICLSLIDEAEDARMRGRFAFADIEGLDHAAENVKKRLNAFLRWASLKGTLRLYYETVAFSPDDAISSIEKLFGVQVPHEGVKKYAFEEAFTQKNKAVSRRHEAELDSEQEKKLEIHFGKFIRRLCEGDSKEWLATYRERVLRSASVRSSRGLVQ